MPADSRTATAAEFNNSARKNAYAFLALLIVAGITYYFADQWASVPGGLALLAGLHSLLSIRAAIQLRNGTYPIPNPNNGAPDGDARNL